MWSKMKDNFIRSTALVSLFAVLGNANQAQAQTQPTIGIEAVTQDSTSFGMNARVGISDNISIRPRVVFDASKIFSNGSLSGVRDISGTEYSLAATYDFKFNNGYIGSVFIGPEISFWDVHRSNFNVDGIILSAMAGVEYPITDSIDVTAKVILPLSATGTINGAGASTSDLEKNLTFGIGVAHRF
jgi:hypothetical protein